MALRKLIQQELKGGWVVSGTCSVCGMRFKPKTPSASSKQIQGELTASFNSHNCTDDANQAAARIVRESTEDK